MMVDFLIDTPEKLGRLLPEALRGVLRTSILKAKEPLRKRVRELIAKGVMNRKETASLLDESMGEVVSLREHLGLANPREAVEDVIAAMQGGLYVEFTPGTGDDLGTLEVGVLRSDYEDVLSSGSARYANEGKAGGVIEWLSWLLFRGSEVVILGSKLVTPPGGRSTSRTGRALMVTPDPVKRKKNNPPSGPAQWGLPLDYGGNEDDNWLTRALNDVSGEIMNAMTEELQRALRG